MLYTLMVRCTSVSKSR